MPGGTGAQARASNGGIDCSADTISGGLSLSHHERRALTPAEEELIRTVTGVLAPDVYRIVNEQLAYAAVIEGASPLALSLSVAPETERIDLPDGPIPVSARVWEGSSPRCTRTPQISSMSTTER